MYKQLRSCTAHVYDKEWNNGKSINIVSEAWAEPVGPITNYYVLRSYSTDVAVYYPAHECVYLLPDYDCSSTTMQHVRKFLHDVAGADATITGIREALAADGHKRLGGILYQEAHTYIINRTN